MKEQLHIEVKQEKL